MIARRSIGIGVTALALGCTAEPSQGATSFGDPDTGTSEAATEGTAVTTGDAEDDTAPAPAGDTTAAPATGDDPKFDLGEAPDAPPPPGAEPCENVDLVFVVDNSGSMAGEQQNLVDSFPGFVDEMLTTLDTVETLHIGVVTTDDNADNAAPCDRMGAMIVQTPYATCGPYTEGAYMTPADDLAQTFACAATLGTGGSGNERPMDALRAALDDEADTCNAGFLRDDALLVVVVITDEEDDHESALGNSQGDPPDWYDAVVAAKSGIETNAAVLSIVGQDPLGDCEIVPFDPNAESSEPGLRLMEFAQMFTYSFIGDVCAEDYQPIFHEAISVIDEACTTFMPPAG